MRNPEADAHAITAFEKLVALSLPGLVPRPEQSR
jgi:hypothetical protein